MPETEPVVKNKRTWSAVKFETSAENEDLASWLMIQCGSCGCQVEPAEGGKVAITASFDQSSFSEEQLANLKASLEEYALGEALLSLKVQGIEEADWLSLWKQGFEPFAVGESFVVCPPWAMDDVDERLLAGRHLVVIEPGMAFGTGLHDTTQYCMRALAGRKSARRVVDVGTGSAILAIACARLFAGAEIVAIDIDPVAIELSEKNCELNGVSERIKLLTGSTDLVASQKFDCILSNLTAEDNVALLPDYLEMLAEDGVIICAGILREKLVLLEKALEGTGLVFADQHLTAMWAGVTLQRGR